MAVNLSPYGGVGAQFFDNAGNVLTGGKIFTYAAGTTTNQATYTTSAGNIFHSNPIILDASGRVPSGGEIWLTDGLLYKFVLKDSNDVLIATYDNVGGINSNFVNFTGEEETQTATQAQTVFTLTTLNYLPGVNNLLVFVNGSKQVVGTNYQETSGTVVTFASGLNAGDVVDFCTATPINTTVVGAEQVSYDPPFIGGVATNVEAKLAQFINAQDFGVVGDGTTDDTAAFLAAVAEAKSLDVPLNIDNLKIYLATQSASIDADDLFIQGNGYITTYVDYPYQEGGDFFNAHKTAALTKVGSVIFSRYDGPIFTGKTFSGNKFSIFCDMTETASSGFKQTTPTAYPGWSQALLNLSSVYIANCGNCGIWLLGGLEVVTLNDIHTFQVNQTGFRVQRTTGVNSPIEYIWLQNSSFQWSFLNNIAFIGVDKHIYIQNCLLNAPQQLSRQTANGFVIANYSDIVPCIYMESADNAVGSFNLNILNNYAEQTNGLIGFNGNPGFRQQQVVVEGNTVYLDQPTADYYMAEFRGTVFELYTYNNRINQGCVYYFPVSATYSQNQFLNFADLATSAPPSIIVESGELYSQQLLPAVKWPTSVSVGTGSAGTFTFTIPTQNDVPVNTGAVPTLYLITANLQAATSDDFGAYLMTVVRLSSGNYVGSVVAFGLTAGFTAPPTISTAGVISVPLAIFFRGRISRVDGLPLNPNYPVNFA